MAHPALQSKEHKASVSNSNSPERTNLSWGYWPDAVAPLTARGQRLWPEVLRAWPPGIQVALLRSDALDLAKVSAWAQLVRRRGLVPALAIAPRLFTHAWLAALPNDVPLLVVICGDSVVDLSDWARVPLVLARHRQPLHRWATLRAPLCLLPTDLIGPNRGDVILAERPQAQPEGPCQRCAAVGQCSAKPQDVGSLLPIPAEVTNQFDLELDGAGPQIGWLREGETHLASTSSADSLAALTLLPGQIGADQVALAVSRQQLYRDGSQVARLGDFALELVPLSAEPARSSDALPVWKVASSSPFAKEEERLLALLADLRGVVIDVGAGPVRYVAALTEAIERGQLTYLAVEPDLGHLQQSAAAMPLGVFVRGVGEQLPLANRSADAVLMLRSWNHLRDPARAVAEAARVLRPGGQLVVVDNVVFGLIRDREQLARAHAIPLQQTPFEHFRNDDALQAWALIDRQLGGAATALALHPVQAGTSNQWLLVVRIGGAGE